MVEKNSWKSPQNIIEMLHRNVADFPDREALVAFSDQNESLVRLTWSQLDRKTDLLSAGFNRLGIKPCTKIAFIHTNRAECIYAYLAVHKIGAIFVPINTRLVAREIEYILSNSEADHVIAGIDFLSIVEKSKDKFIKHGKFICIEKRGTIAPNWAVPFRELFNCGDSFPRITISPYDNADLIYTSGTTGKPKGVILTHANKIANGRMAGLAMELLRSRYIKIRFQNPFPFFTSATVSTVMMSWLYYGHTLIFEQSFDVLETLKTIEKEKSTITFSIPNVTPEPETKASGDVESAPASPPEAAAPVPAVVEKPVPSTPETAPADEPAMSSAELAAFLDRTFIIRFQMDSNDFSDDAYDLMNRIAHAIRQKPGLKVSVSGYTDSLGNYNYNRRLSEFRATVVKSYLIGQGVAPMQITTYGQGPENPIESNSTREGRAANRRVEIVISE